METLRFMASAFEAPALGDKNARRTPLKKEDDPHEDEDLAEHRVEEDLLEALVEHTNTKSADDRTDEVADASDDHSHESIDNVFLPEARADIVDL